MSSRPSVPARPALAPVSLSTRRFALGTAIAAWSLYLVIAMVQCLVYGARHPFMLLERHVLGALVAVGLSIIVDIILTRYQGRDLSRQLTTALLLAVPSAALLSVINYNVMYVFAPQDYLRDMGMDMHLSLIGEVLFSLTSNYFIFSAWSVLSIAVGHELRMRETVRRAAETEAAARSAELRALRLQLDPHFLFNTLNTVSGLILDGDSDSAERMIEALSSFLRATLEGDATADIPLSEELRLQMLYLQIEQVRFGGRIQVVTDIEDELLQSMVPALILQPIIENSVRHGVARSSRPVRITIAARRQRDRLVLVVDDDGPPGAAAGGHGIGLANVASRLALRYGQDARSEFRQAATGGMRNELSIPISITRPAPALFE